jgi:hypothetical protein
MTLAIMNLRGGVDLALAMYGSVDSDDRERLRSALAKIRISINDLQMLTVAFDQGRREPLIEKTAPDCVVVGIDEHRFAPPCDLPTLQRFITDATAGAIPLMDLPESEKEQILTVYNEWRVALKEPIPFDDASD